MFGSSLPSVVCLIYVICVCFACSGVPHILCCVFVLIVLVLCLVYGGVQHILCCVSVLIVLVLCLARSGVPHILCCVFVRLMYPRLSISLNCTFLIEPSVCFNIYLLIE